jgi:hypothetical protein
MNFVDQAVACNQAQSLPTSPTERHSRRTLPWAIRRFCCCDYRSEYSDDPPWTLPISTRRSGQRVSRCWPRV